MKINNENEMSIQEWSEGKSIEEMEEMIDELKTVINFGIMISYVHSSLTNSQKDMINYTITCNVEAIEYLTSYIKVKPYLYLISALDGVK